MTRLIQWDLIELRISGARVAELARQEVAARKVPLTDLRLDFVPGQIGIAGKAVKGISLPFRLAIRRIVPRGSSIDVPFESVSAFGFIPLPRLLFQLFGSMALADGVELHPETMTLTLRLDRFLPSFVDAEVEEVRIIAGGLIVRIGPGGADPPPASQK